MPRHTGRSRNGRLYLSVKKAVKNNFAEFNRCRKADLPYASVSSKEKKSLLVTPSRNNIERSQTTDVRDELEREESTVDVDVQDFEMEVVLEEPQPQQTTQTLVVGRRLVDYEYHFKALQEISLHGLNRFGCTLNNLEICSEQKCGLNSIVSFKCNMCNQILKISTNPEDETKQDINTAAVEGIMSIGGGFYNLEEFCSTMEVPSMGEKMYRKHHRLVANGWKIAAVQQMEAAAKKEADFAIQQGNVDENGVPCISVVADGCWSKRSYRTNYSALSGAGAIVGKQFGEILYLAIKNKFCIICNKAEEKNETAKEHVCFKNFLGSSTSMESSIIVEGFKQSEQLYGIKYSQLIADGDGSTYKKILEAKPYDNITVEKIECRNHILRNFCNKLQNLTTESRYPLVFRKLLKQKILRIRTGIKYAIKYNKELQCDRNEKIQLLQKDINNTIYHVFDDHSKCAAYFCKNKYNQTENLITKIKTCEDFFNKLQNIMNSVSRHARSLIYDFDSNIVEQFHSVVAKFVGGKRINYSKSDSYQSRCYGAVVSFNTKRPHYILHKTLCEKSPSKIKSQFEVRRQAKVKRVLKYKQTHKATTNVVKINSQEDPDYGVYGQREDMTPEEYATQKNTFLNNLKRDDSARIAFEKETRLQADSGKWLEERRKLLTSSNFSKVCSRRPTTSCVNLVKTLLYSSQILHCKSINHGKHFEDIARTLLAQQIGKEIYNCGMFIDKEFNFLGATPDGVIDDKTIVEIKCPFSMYNNNNLDEAIQNGKLPFYKKNSEINKNHSWYVQIQGQLRISGRSRCILGIFVGQELPLKVEEIEKDVGFWKTKMEPKLVEFYMDCLLPELVDPRHTRNMKIRDPDYILQAIEKKKVDK